MAYIGANPAESYASFANQTFTGDGSTTTFTLNHSVSNSNEIALFVNNVRQQPGSSFAYTATGNSLTLSEAISSSDSMYCIFLGRALGTINPPNNSVGADQTADTIISGQTELATIPATTDEFLISDAGTIKRIDSSLITTGYKIASASGTAQTGTSSIEIALPETYKAFRLYLNIKPETDNAHLDVTLSTDEGSSYHTATNNYVYGYQHIYANATAHDVVYSNGATEIEISKDGGNNTANAEGHHLIFNIKPLDTESSVNQVNHLTWEGSRFDGSNAFREIRGSGALAATYTNKVNYIKFAYDSGNIEDYFYTVYGFVG